MNFTSLFNNATSTLNCYVHPSLVSCSSTATSYLSSFNISPALVVLAIGIVLLIVGYAANMLKYAGVILIILAVLIYVGVL